MTEINNISSTKRVLPCKTGLKVTTGLFFYISSILTPVPWKTWLLTLVITSHEPINNSKDKFVSIVHRVLYNPTIKMFCFATWALINEFRARMKFTTFSVLKFGIQINSFRNGWLTQVYKLDIQLHEMRSQEMIFHC